MKIRQIVAIFLLIAVLSAFAIGAGSGKDNAGAFFDLPDGTYTGEHPDFNGSTLMVEVMLSGGKIRDINIIKDNGDNYAYNARKVIKSIIKEQSLEVDTVTGATITSSAIIGAVKDAVDK